MEEGCAQEQKRVALGRGHQDAEAIDAARQAPPPPPPTLSNPLRFPPSSRSLSLSIYLLSKPLSPILDPPLPSNRAHYVSIYVWMHLSKRRRGKNSQACSTRGCSTFGISCSPRGFWILRYASTVEMNTSFDGISGGTWARVIKIEGGGKLVRNEFRIYIERDGSIGHRFF